MKCNGFSIQFDGWTDNSSNHIMLIYVNYFDDIKGIIKRVPYSNFEVTKFKG